MEADEVLMQAVAAGDGAAFAEIRRRDQGRLYRFLARQTGNRDVEDLYQDTWLRVVRAAGRFDARRRFSTWLFQIALNRCRDWHRRPPPVPVADAGQMVEVDGTAAAEAALDARRLLDTLPAPQREVVVLRYCLDLGEAEVAEIVGCPPGTVKSRLHTAMARLAEVARAAAPTRGRRTGA